METKKKRLSETIRFLYTQPKVWFVSKEDCLENASLLPLFIPNPGFCSQFITFRIKTNSVAKG